MQHHPRSIAEYGSYAGSYQVMLGGGEAADHPAARQETGGGSGVDQHRNQQELVG